MALLLTVAMCRAEMDMEPTSEATKLEGPGRFLEYKGVGKLRGKKVLITGGEYVPLSNTFASVLRFALESSI